MCDYSLETYSSRPAREFERYETHRFPSGSIGLVSPANCKTAICVQYDTRLMIDALPAALRASLKLGETAQATFIRLDHGAYRDGLMFDSGKRISLQQLGTGVSVTATQLLEKAPAPVKTASRTPVWRRVLERV